MMLLVELRQSVERSEVRSGEAHESLAVVVVGVETFHDRIPPPTHHWDHHGVHPPPHQQCRAC